MKTVNSVLQTMEEKIDLAINDNGKTIHLSEKSVRRMLFPQEFLIFIENRSDFEFVVWWNEWDLDKPLNGTEKINRPVTVLRRI